MKKTVKVFALAMALIMSIAAFSAFSVFADDAAPSVLPTMPTVTEAEKEARTYYFHKDFSTDTKEGINVSPKPADLKVSGGFWLCNETNGDFDVVDGYLKMMGTAYVDLQLYALSDYSCKEDIVFSVKLMPLSENISGEFINFIRRDGQAGNPQKWAEKVVMFKDGNILYKGEDLGKMRLGEWVLLEIAFDYNDAEKAYDAYTVMINGKEIGSGALDIDTYLLTQIKHFRFFRSMTNYTYAVDDINIVSGTKSVLYAKDYTDEPVETEPVETQPAETQAPETQAPETQAPETQAPETQAPDTKPVDTKAPETQAPDTKPADSKPADTDEAKSGCGSVIGASAAVVAIVGFGAVVATRKKRD